MVSESRVTWATSVPILVFLGRSVLELGPMYVTDVRQKHRLMHMPYGGGGITTLRIRCIGYIGPLRSERSSHSNDLCKPQIGALWSLECDEHATFG